MHYQADLVFFFLIECFVYLSSSDIIEYFKRENVTIKQLRKLPSILRCLLDELKKSGVIITNTDPCDEKNIALN